MKMNNMSSLKPAHLSPIDQNTTPKMAFSKMVDKSGSCKLSKTFFVYFTTASLVDPCKDAK